MLPSNLGHGSLLSLVARRFREHLEDLRVVFLSIHLRGHSTE